MKLWLNLCQFHRSNTSLGLLCWEESLDPNSNPVCRLGISQIHLDRSRTGSKPLLDADTGRSKPPCPPKTAL